MATRLVLVLALVVLLASFWGLSSFLLQLSLGALFFVFVGIGFFVVMGKHQPRAGFLLGLLLQLGFFVNDGIWVWSDSGSPLYAVKIWPLALLVYGLIFWAALPALHPSAPSLQRLERWVAARSRPIPGWLCRLLGVPQVKGGDR